jgi:hypothetical protein
VKLHENFTEFSLCEEILISIFTSKSFFAVRNVFLCDIFFVVVTLQRRGHCSCVSFRMNWETKQHISC